MECLFNRLIRAAKITGASPCFVEKLNKMKKIKTLMLGNIIPPCKHQKRNVNA
jgi:hypothetical protein